MTLLLQILAVYGLAYMLTKTAGINNSFYKLRKNESLPFYCFACTAFWVSVVVALYGFIDVLSYAILVLALCGASIALYEATRKNY